MTPRCYNGKILHINLDDQTCRVEMPPESFYRQYGGGSAMGMYYILKNMDPRLEALSPENILTIFTGVPTGLPISGLSRVTINAKSPLSDAIGDSQAGGFFPARMKACGYDGIVVRGKAASPVYLWINDGEVEFRDASHLWGKTTGEVEDRIKAELGDPKAEIMQVGPAGERQVRFAAVMNMSNRANGRTGMGAVMGSKNLKAVVVQGTQKMTAADPKKIAAMFRSGTKQIPDNPVLDSFHKYGTAGDVPVQQSVGGLPTRNFNEGQFEFSDEISGETAVETILKDRDTCFSCTVRCKRVVETEFQGRDVLPRYGGAEYETTATFGSYCAVRDLNAISLANQLCNLFGMDTISCGATIAFAMECFEKGIIGLEQTGGIDLRFGNAEAMVRMVEMIAERAGFGDVLAEGSRRAAELIGGEAADCLITAKGQELPAHMPQSKKALGLMYAVNPFGADHESSEHDPTYEIDSTDAQCIARMAELGLEDLQTYGSFNDEKARMIAVTQRAFSVLDSYNLCSFVWGVGFQLYGPNDIKDMINAAAGWDMTLEEVLLVGERRINMMRAFNAAAGFTRADDMLSPKFFRPLQGEGPTAGEMYTLDQFESVKDAYYRHADWDTQTGNPSKVKLSQLGLEWINLNV